MKLKFGNAFTLAEVLITLGIIGVVAALTMPSLIQNHKKHVVETRLKKFYSVMNQAVLMAKNDYGDFENWDYWTTDKKDEDGKYILQQDAMRHSIEKYFMPYMKIDIRKIDLYGDYEGETAYMYFLPDGSAFAPIIFENREFNYYPANPEKCLKRGANGEDISGSCEFLFGFWPTNNSPVNKYQYKKGVMPYLHRWDGKIELLYSGAEELRSCEDRGDYCAGLIYYNGWKIPKNYPKKINY